MSLLSSEIVENSSRSVKLIISLILYCIDTIGYQIAKLMKLSSSGGYLPIYYHNVRKDQLKDFVWQIDLLQKNCHLTNSYKGTPDLNGRMTVSITFDDGYTDLLSTVIPELEQRKIPAIFFIPTQFIGDRPKWSIRDAVELTDLSIMIFSESEIQCISKHSLFKIGSHTNTHRNLAEIENAEILEEMQASKKILEKITGKSVNMISFPYGGFNRDTARIAVECGYEYSFSILPSVVYTHLNKTLPIGRTEVDPENWKLEFFLKIAGSYRWLPLAFEIKRHLFRGIT